MFRTSRWLLRIALFQFAFCFIALAILLWPSLILIAACLFAWCKRRDRSLWAYGTSRWANEDDLRKIGMIGGNKGLSIGRLGNAAPLTWISCIWSVMDSKLTPEVACERCLSRLGNVDFRRKAETVRLSKAVHSAVFGPTGTGKGVSFVIPWLLDTDEAAVVLDFKGECASRTANVRERKFGHRVVLLDPFKKVTQTPDSLNAIDFIEKDSPIAIDDCRDLAEQLVTRTGEEREPHWNETAEMWIGAANIAVVQHAEADHRSLQTVRDVLSNPDRIPKLLELLCKSEGMVARMGNQLAHFRDKELSSTLTTANRHLRFLDTPAIEASTSSSSFDPNKLRDGKMTVYCILPPEHMRAQAALIRMWVGTLMRTVVRGGLQCG